MASNLLITMTCAGHLLIDTKSYNALILEIVIVLSQISFAVETQIRSQPLKKEKWIAYLIPKLLQFEDSSMNKKIKKVLIVFIGQIWITWSYHWYRNDKKIYGCTLARLMAFPSAHLNLHKCNFHLAKRFLKIALV